ncbi:MAG: hypothetical protein ABW207_08480 [Stenotrophomonas chelatiphaga]|uniref:hypothetical protein n=1 Tax=Stenotrophomonas chelatiphaga TaxID=517011 RepID=UPI000AABF401|nr:hypothetical protein [Stenotrophomonas chelatiphaga]
MSTNAEESNPRDPSPDPTIHLAIDNVTLAPQAGAAIDFRISASTLLNPSAGYQLWSEDSEGKLHRHSATKSSGEMHSQPFGTRQWWASVGKNSNRTMRFFAARERENPRRASEYVDVPLPEVPPPAEFTARDGVMKVVATGRVRPNASAQLSVSGRVTTVEANRDGRWTATVVAAEGTHTASAIALDVRLGNSAPASTSVTVSAPPHIPLGLQFPEEGRKITRITRVTGVSTPYSDLQVSLGEGPPATATANPGGAWEVSEVRSERSGEVVLRVENLSTGEVVERRVEVDYFSPWSVSRLIAGPLVDETGLVTRFGAIAEGTGEHFDIIEFSVGRDGPWTELSTVDENGVWRFEHLITPPPAPFRPGRLFLRTASDPLAQLHTVEFQAPIITSPREGAETGPTPVFSGTAVGPFDIELADGSKQHLRPDKENKWSIEVGPLAPGEHTIIARMSSRPQREITRRTIRVLAEAPPGVPDVNP